MKIMDKTSDDEECQVKTVISSKAKEGKKDRLPFQTIATESPKVNKKRKLAASPEVRNAKQAKVNTKENSFKKNSKKVGTSVLKEKDDEVDEIQIDETEDAHSTSKEHVSTKTPGSKDKKSTSSKGSSKSKKSEPKIQTNSLIKFFKKIDKDNTENKNDVKSPVSKNENNESKKLHIKEKQVSTSPKDKKDEGQTSDLDIIQISESDDQDDEHQENEITQIVNKKKLEESDNSEEKDSVSSNENDLSQTDVSQLNETDLMDVDSDDNIVSDDDSIRSDSDSKKTEHEDTDSKDDVKRGEGRTSTASNRRVQSVTKGKKLTPKQIERKQEIQKKREMREKQRLEREKKLQEERENRKKEKEEKKKEREEKEKALKELKRKEKELKELKKQNELEQKQKEKEAKEEERRKREEAKEEEKRRKEEEKLEAERKKQKAASSFVSFFVAKKPSQTKPAEEENKNEEKYFMPFEIKADMRIAPVTRRSLTEDEKSKLDKVIESNDLNKSKLYIVELKNKKFNVRKSERTWPYEAIDDDIVVIDEEEASSNVVQGRNVGVEKHRAKFFLFEENRRPPYYGTWRKKSKTINPRRPFSKDTKCFDYEVDSDDEWEEEEPGESLRGSDDEKDEENAEENEYDVDNDFMVPHGYLSEEEIGADEEDEDEDLNPENQNAKLKILGEQFEAERKTKTTKLKPKVIGCAWLNANNAYPENTPAYAVQFLTTRQAWTKELPLLLTPPADGDNFNENECGTPSTALSSARKAKALEEAMPDFIRLIHGNRHGQAFLIKEFLEFWSKKKEHPKPLPKSKLFQKLKEVATWMACPEPGPIQDKFCWYVTEAVRAKYLGSEKLTLPNSWSYCLTPRKKVITFAEGSDKVDDKEKEKEKEKKTVPLITQFTKTLTAEEKQKQLNEKPSTPSTSASKSNTPTTKLNEKPSTPSTSASKSNTPTTKLNEKPSTPSTSASKSNTPTIKPPKRAVLISVPRGEPLPKSPRVSLMDKFVTKDSSNVMDDKNSKKKDENDEECMIIDDDEKIDIISVTPEKAVAKESNTKVATEADLQDTTIEDEEDCDQIKSSSQSSEVDIEEI